MSQNLGGSLCQSGFISPMPWRPQAPRTKSQYGPMGAYSPRKPSDSGLALPRVFVSRCCQMAPSPCNLGIANKGSSGQGLREIEPDYAGEGHPSDTRSFSG